MAVSSFQGLEVLTHALCSNVPPSASKSPCMLYGRNPSCCNPRSNGQVGSSSLLQPLRLGGARRNLSCCYGQNNGQVGSSGLLPPLGSGSARKRRERNAGLAAVMSAESVSAAPTLKPRVADQLRPSHAEAARTIVDICREGTLSTLMEDEWPTATAVRFALDIDGRPLFRFSPLALHTQNVALDNRCSLHVLLEQPGPRRPQCTLRGRVHKINDPKLDQKMDFAWEKRFGKDRDQEDAYYVMDVEQVLHSQDMGEEEVWVPGEDFGTAAADPLRECAARIVEDMNRKHWEDVRRFCKSHARLEAEVEEVSMTWVDRLGFDLRVLTTSPQTLLEVRIPFSREVKDERDARSSLTMMAQIAWEQERNYTPPDVQRFTAFNLSS